MFIHLPDFSVTSKADMFEILGGKVEFYPGWNVQRESSFIAPNLKQPIHRLASNATQGLMDEMYVDPEAQKGLQDMMKFIRVNNNQQEEA